jgi:dTMP kinase
MKGLLITFEGCEGSGKSTQAGRLVERMRDMKFRVLSVREPGGTRTGEIIREILQHDKSMETIFPETEILLFAASRAQLVRQVILPALESGECVVCDRYADSTAAYQGYGRLLDPGRIMEINAMVMGAAIPDITLLMDIDVRLGFERLHHRQMAAGSGHDRIEREDLAFHERVRKGYQDIAAKSPDRFIVIDASQNEDAVADAVWEIVGKFADRLRPLEET